jgi:hypothetical protein
MELGTPPRGAKAVNQALTPSTVGSGDMDTLSATNRLEVPHFPNELSTQPISFGDRMPPKDLTPILSKAAGKIDNGTRQDTKTKKVASVGPKPTQKTSDPKRRPKTTESKTVLSTHRTNAHTDAKPCRLNTFDSFLKAFNLPTGCEV